MDRETYESIVANIEAPELEEGVYQTGPKGVKADYEKAKIRMRIRVSDPLACFLSIVKVIDLLVTSRENKRH